jgi:hypothetical protein
MIPYARHFTATSVHNHTSVIYTKTQLSNEHALPLYPYHYVIQSSLSCFHYTQAPVGHWGSWGSDLTLARGFDVSWPVQLGFPMNANQHLSQDRATLGAARAHDSGTSSAEVVP